MAHSPLSFRKDVKEASLFQWNARGLRSRISDFRPFILAHKFPIIVVCEPNLQTTIRLSGYEAFSSASCNVLSKVVVYVRCELTYVLHSVVPHDDDQYVCLTVKTKKLTFTLVAAYISPNSRFDMQRLGALLSATPGPWILSGDFNAHHPLWGSLKMDSKGKN